MSHGEFTGLALRDRAVALLTDSGWADDEALLAHVYGGVPPVGLRPGLIQPLLADDRLQRHADGRWSLRLTAPSTAFTALALVATGPTPGRGRLVRVSALHVQGEQVAERFDVMLNPGKRVPRYVADRAGVDPEVLNDQPTFAEIISDLVRFLGDRSVLAQDARLTWAFLVAEARLYGTALREPPLIDANELATRVLQMNGKPTLGVVAAHLGLSTTRITQTDEEARMLAMVGRRLLALGSAEVDQVSSTGAATALRRGATARTLPDEPGVYVLRDNEQQPLYVGKARRLRSRVAAYVQRPLGATRRLEGLVGSVEAVDTTQCQTDLEALILEDREIRRLRPRFNTVRQQRRPRYWIRRPPARVSARGRLLAPPRLELSIGPESEDGEFVGPFRNEMLAEQARHLARDVFDLDNLRHTRALDYSQRLAHAWEFLQGETSRAETLARARSVRMLRKVVAFDVASMLLPADPRHARYAVVRPGPTGVEGFLLQSGLLLTWSVLQDDDVSAFAQRLLQPAAPRTGLEDADVVLRWLGAQRPPARLVHLPDDALAAADAIEDAAYALTPEA